jgi:hypothetical protein
MSTDKVKRSKQVKKSKTETSKERLVYVYLPSHEMVQQWKDSADNADMTLSKFVIEHVNNSLKQEQKKEGFASRAEIIDEHEKIKKDNEELRQKNKDRNESNKEIDYDF